MGNPPLVLLGSGEFLPSMGDIDRRILARTGKTRPRVAILPTAAGHEEPRQWTDMGVEHFAELGAEPVAVMAIDRVSCDDPRMVAEIERADVIYFSGGKPGYLLDCLRGSALWSAVVARHEAGAVLAGSSAGAMLLGERTLAPDDFQDGWPRVIKIVDGMRLLPGVVVLPHFDIIPTDKFPLFTGLVPADLWLLGIDEDTALLRLDGAWCVAGKGRVRLTRGMETHGPFAAGELVNVLA